VETLGPLNECMRISQQLNLGRKIGDNAGDDRSTSFLFQRISVLVQRFNAVFLNKWQFYVGTPLGLEFLPSLFFIPPSGIFWFKKNNNNAATAAAWCVLCETDSFVNECFNFSYLLVSMRTTMLLLAVDIKRCSVESWKRCVRCRRPIGFVPPCPCKLTCSVCCWSGRRRTSFTSHRAAKCYTVDYRLTVWGHSNNAAPKYQLLKFPPPTC